MFELKVNTAAFYNSAAANPVQAVNTLIRKGAFLSVGVKNNTPVDKMTAEQRTEFHKLIASFKVFQVSASSTPWETFQAIVKDEGWVAHDGSAVSPDSVVIKRIA
jgi:hypothetical protein